MGNALQVVRRAHFLARPHHLGTYHTCALVWPLPSAGTAYQNEAPGRCLVGVGLTALLTLFWVSVKASNFHLAAVELLKVLNHCFSS